MRINGIVLVNYDILSYFLVMTPNFAITPTQPQASQAMLWEHLAKLEATLLEARGRVMLSFDRELASLRGWMDSLDSFDPTTGLHAVSEPAPDTDAEPLQELIADAPQLAACNIVPFTGAAIPGSAALIEEPPVDPNLERATIDELNAALVAAFDHVAER